MNHNSTYTFHLPRMTFVSLLSIVFSCCACAQQNSPPSAPTSAPTSAPPSAPTSTALKTPPIPVAGLNISGGRIFNIEPGVAFNSLASFLQPGDEVRLLPGVHIPFALVDLRGTRENPILIRGYQTEADKPPPYVKGESFSISLVRPKNVIVRDLLLGNSLGPTIYVDGSVNASPLVQETPWDSNLILTNLRLKQDSQSSAQTGIYFRCIQKADISHFLIKGWNNSAIVLDNCKFVSISEASSNFFLYNLKCVR